MTTARCRNGCTNPTTCVHVREALILATRVRTESQRREVCALAGVLVKETK
jgi:hypothetical protein